MSFIKTPFLFWLTAIIVYFLGLYILFKISDNWFQEYRFDCNFFVVMSIFWFGFCTFFAIGWYFSNF